MRRFDFLAVVLGLALTGQTRGVDPAKIDRSLRKEPTYKSKQPRYCLLVLGPGEARVWVALDGDALYLDRNGNGDLTDPGERVAAEVLRPGRPDVEAVYRFELTKARDGPIVTCGPEVHWFLVVQFVPPAGWPDQAWVKLHEEKPYQLSVTTKAGRDQWADVRFATSPREAPIVHFDGPLSFALSGQFDPPCFRPGEPSELAVELRTQVRDAVVRTGFLEVPEDAHPVAEIEFPPARPGEDPTRVRVELKERC